MTPEQWKARYPNFSISEVYSPKSLLKLETSGYRLHVIDFDFMDLIQAFREHLGRRVLINHGGSVRRGVRTPREHFNLYKEIGKDGLAFSWHVAGKAADLTAEGLSAQLLLEAVLQFRAEDLHYKRFTGVGYYPNSNFVHVDVRPLVDEHNPIRWTVG